MLFNFTREREGDTMSLLEQLSGITPRRKQASAAQAVIALHVDEIEEARRLGYSWWDITKAAMAAWAEEWPSGYRLHDGTLQRVYRGIREGGATWTAQ